MKNDFDKVIKISERNANRAVERVAELINIDVSNITTIGTVTFMEGDTIRVELPIIPRCIGILKNYFSEARSKSELYRIIDAKMDSLGYMLESYDEEDAVIFIHKNPK
jgi:integrase